MRTKEKITKKIICLITIALVMSSCDVAFIIVIGTPIMVAEKIDKNKRKSINRPKNKIETIPFDSLPDEVKELFYSSKNMLSDEKNMPAEERRNFHNRGLHSLNTVYEYQLESILGGAGGLSHFLVIDKTNNISYALEVGDPFPVVIFDRDVFIIASFGSSSRFDGFNDWIFNRYSLDGAKQTHIVDVRD
jgi:hypothetical protein